jgi:hypothetical protein
VALSSSPRSYNWGTSCPLDWSSQGRRTCNGMLARLAKLARFEAPVPLCAARSDFHRLPCARPVTSGFFQATEMSAARKRVAPSSPGPRLRSPRLLIIMAGNNEISIGITYRLDHRLVHLRESRKKGSGGSSARRRRHPRGERLHLGTCLLCSSRR